MHFHGAGHGSPRVVGAQDGSPKDHQDAVADEFVDGALVLLDDFGHGLQIDIDHRHHILSGQTLTYGGEAAQIGHENSSTPFFTPDFQSALLQNRVDDFIREVAAEGLANKPVAQFQGGVEFSAIFAVALLLDPAAAFFPDRPAPGLAAAPG